ncbi:ZIP family metal transporter [Brevibacillus agri]|uniref:ZIP family metal transporter n=1 Tax=Paenibacillaceae TaxID=186822 RepID=UPI00047A359C|nr:MULTISPECIES: ZIP family metal transporter [Brevibacillus]QHZ54489.1 ZIP family metal transporter [Brevibacillus sp. NSP2.1]MED1646867.1 ZIP family metal transporter [Brevibacillus agri]MED1700765.1 ZIP family metal transporter [Brevibacillus agri]MED4569602.1 ZIP family metal transporter [Brevibacillus agri]PSJ66181.1 ZIP family metal transporter [Brevibacillus brevis]
MSWSVVGFVLLAAAANVVGGLFILFKKHWSKRGINGLMALSAGLLLSIAIMDLIPEAIEVMPTTPVFVLAGIMALFFFQQFVASHFHFGEETHHHGNEKSAAVGAFFGMMIHTFFDGLSIVASFEVDVRLGVTVLIAILMHKIPDGLTISSIVFAMSRKRGQAVVAALLLGLSTIFGAVVAMMLSHVALPHEQITAIAIAFTAGIFLYVAGTDLLPVVNAAEDRPIASLFFLGIFLYFLLQWGFHLLAPTLH